MGEYERKPSTDEETGEFCEQARALSPPKYLVGEGGCIVQCALTHCTGATKSPA